MSEQSTNPKDKIGRTKPSPHLIPAPAIMQEARVMGLGAAKYGPYNWRDKTVAASVYVSAAYRHLMTWFDGEDTDRESGASHLAHARACLGILLDAESQRKLVDDRPPAGGTASLIERLTVDSAASGGYSATESRMQAEAFQKTVVNPGVSPGSVVPVDKIPEVVYNHPLTQEVMAVGHQEIEGEEVCPDCQKRGWAVDEFLSPHNGRCKDCSEGVSPPVGPLETRFVETDRTTPKSWRGLLRHCLVENQGCPEKVAEQIVAGTSFPEGWGTKESRQIVYVAGPMRGHPAFNFPAFDAVRDLWLSKGYAVISPADIDRYADDLDPKVDFEKGVDDVDQSKYVLRDFHAIYLLNSTFGDKLVMLPGWVTSVGASAEFAVAKWLGLTRVDTNGCELD